MSESKSITLADIHARCTEDCDCLLWTGAMDKSRPKLGDLQLRRVVWELAGKQRPSQMIVVVTCGNSRCLEPMHLKLATASEVRRETLKSAALLQKLSASASKTKRAKFAKLDEEKVTAIRNSGKRGADLAKEYGVSESTVSSVLNYRRWKPAANPFAGLMPK
jgi:hypothetical protein